MDGSSSPAAVRSRRYSRSGRTTKRWFATVMVCVPPAREAISLVIKAAPMSDLFDHDRLAADVKPQAAVARPQAVPARHAAGQGLGPAHPGPGRQPEDEPPDPGFAGLSGALACGGVGCAVNAGHRTGDLGAAPQHRYES